MSGEGVSAAALGRRAVYTLREPYYHWAFIGVGVSLTLHQGLGRWLIEGEDLVPKLLVDGQLTAGLLFLTCVVVLGARIKQRRSFSWLSAVAPFFWIGLGLIPISGILQFSIPALLEGLTSELGIYAIILPLGVFSIVGLPLMISSIAVFCLFMVVRKPCDEDQKVPDQWFGAGMYELRRPVWLWLLAVCLGIGLLQFAAFSAGNIFTALIVPVAGLIFYGWVRYRGSRRRKKFLQFLSIAAVAMLLAFVVAAFHHAAAMAVLGAPFGESVLSFTILNGFTFFLVLIPVSLLMTCAVLRPLRPETEL